MVWNLAKDLEAEADEELSIYGDRITRARTAVYLARSAAEELGYNLRPASGG